MAHNIEQTEIEIKNLKFENSSQEKKQIVNIISMSKSEESKSSGSSSSSSSGEDFKAIHQYLESG